jgi:hypothetical protein
MNDRPQDSRDDASLLQAAPGLVRIAAGAWWRTAAWTVDTSVRAGSRVVQAAVSGEPVGDLIQDARAELREHARRFLELADSQRGGRPPSAPRGSQPRAVRRPEPTIESLREQGAELLRRSADVNYEEAAHPAYERILGQLAPDEGRILRLLTLEGPQPAVDVRAGKPLKAGSELVAPGLSMIGAESGCRHLDRVPAYLNNLYRLGLIWFSREPLPDPLSYQVLEAQPDVLAALRESGRGRTVRRSIHLTPFGEDFCRICLPLETAELEALPREAPAGDGEAPPA